jgi:hypothetical protein
VILFSFWWWWLLVYIPFVLASYTRGSILFVGGGGY